jgi:fermentation-respiration switch protein FrsA (DUF1100 family)
MGKTMWVPLIRDIFLFVVAAGVVGYLGMLLFSVLYGDRLLFPMPPSSYSSVEGEIRIPVEGGEEIVAAWRPLAASRGTILYSHGNAEDLGVVGTWLEVFREAGFQVLAYDYPGYGLSPGVSTTESVNAAADACWSWLVEGQGIAPSSIFPYGRSLGGGPALELAIRRPVGGVITEATFLSAYRVMTKWQLLPWDRFNNLAAVRELTVPLLVIHGTGDRIVPFSHGRALVEAAAGPKTFCWVDGAGHNDIYEIARPVVTEALRRFVPARTVSDKAPVSAPALPPAST